MDQLATRSRTVLEVLRSAARAHGFRLDPAQERAAQAFQRLQGELTRAGGLVQRLLARKRAVRGVYLWGGVGRGKSFLMDAFFHGCPLPDKQRQHFHRFMQATHQQLRALQGQPDPLQVIARASARHTRLLCLDELHVSDIGDAMLMRGLLEGLFGQGVALVTTSNQHPDELYEHGLQRAQFVPAIELLKTHTEIIELDGGQDYRLRALEKAGVYHFPLDATARRALEEGFESVAGERGEASATLEIEGRPLEARRVAPGTAWFDFAAVCDGPRGTADYIELARRYHTVLLWGVPCFRPELRESLRRFTWLVDEFYDRNVKLMVAAEGSVTDLFGRVEATAELDRTRSRLIEMQTARYLTRPHLA